MKKSNDERVALDWICSIESEKSRVRDGDLYPLLKNWVNRVSPSQILEIGCGQGICSDKIDLDGRAYTGLELSPLLVGRANELYGSENRRFVLGDACAQPFQDGFFDAAYSISVWHLIDDLQKATNEMSRVLNARGQFMIVTANPSAYSAWRAIYTESKINGRRLEGKVLLPDGSALEDVLFLHTLDEITDALKAAGLKADEVTTFRPSSQANQAGGQGMFISIQGRKTASKVPLKRS